MPNLENAGAACREIRERNPVLACVAVAAALTLLRYSIANIFDLNVLLNEEASIYLHAAEKSPLELFLMPDSNYINFINKFCAFFTLRVLKIIDGFAVAQNLVNWFAGALFSTFFLARRCGALIPSFRARLLLITYCYLLPILDAHMVFGQGYYVFFALCWYGLLLYGKGPVSGGEKLCLILTSPFAVFSKPVYFVFAFAFLALLPRELFSRQKGAPDRDARLCLCAWLLAMYAFQACYTLAQPWMASYAFALDTGQGLWQSAFFFTKKCLIILGYGLFCPLAHCLARPAANALCLAGGLAVLAMLAINLTAAARARDVPRGALLLLLAGSTALAFYGVLSVDFLYQRFFQRDIFAAHSGQRLVFPMVLLALFNLAFFCRRFFAIGERACVLALGALCVLAFSIPRWNSWSTGYAPSFTWSETRPLLDEPHVFIPYAYGMRFYYLRGLRYVSPELPVESLGNGIFVVHELPAGRMIRYLMLRQKPGANAIALASGTILRARADGTEYRGELVNPGMREWFLFKFPVFVPAKAFARCELGGPNIFAGNSARFLSAGLAGL